MSHDLPPLTRTWERLLGVQEILATTIGSVRRYCKDLRPSLLTAVAQGMNDINALAADIAAAPAAQGKTLSEGIEPLSMPIEGTVQENSQETYDAYEGAFTLLESGDVTKAAEGAKAVDDATKACLAEFPASRSRDCLLLALCRSSWWSRASGGRSSFEIKPSGS